MLQNLISAKTLKEKLNIIEQQQHNRNLTPQDCEGIYRALNSNGPDSYILVKTALLYNIGGLVPKDYYGFNKKTFDVIIESVKELDVMGLYTCFFHESLKLRDSLRSEMGTYILKQLGFISDKLVLEFRKQGVKQKRIVILDQLHLIKENKPKTLDDIERQERVIDLITYLCPNYMTFNPELFTYMLLPFQSVPDEKNLNLKLLQRLGEVMIAQCKSDYNLNKDHDWLALLSGIFEQAHSQDCIGMFLLLKKMEGGVIKQLLYSNKKYLLLNYFNTPNNALGIFQGLTKYFIIEENLEIIKEVSQMLLDEVIQHRSLTHMNILQEIYQKFILVTILGNIQMITCNNDIIDLLSFYIIGFSQSEVPFQDQAIQLLCKRLQLLLNLRFKSKDYITPIIDFLKSILIAYPQLKQNDQFFKVYQYAQEQATSQGKYSNYKQRILYEPWRVTVKDLQGSKIHQIDNEENKTSYVGLENLTNTCFMNSFLQSLFMNQTFRQSILAWRQQFVDIQFEEQKAMLTGLYKLFMLLTYQNGGFCSPYQLKRELREPYSNTNDQQDVSEFGHHFMEDLQTILPQQAQNELVSMFFGYQHSVLECSLCPHPKGLNIGQKEKFYGLDLYFNKGNQQSQILDINLKSMIQSCFLKEQLDFKCEKCNKKSEFNTKSNKLLVLPPTLMMTIHRFTYDPVTYQMTKILQKVPFEFELDMREIFPDKKLDPQSSVYKLYAFIVHLGQNSNSGHYITYARKVDTQPNIWVAFDDTQITSQEIESSSKYDEQLIEQETPYILFYQNSTMKPLVFNE